MEQEGARLLGVEELGQEQLALSQGVEEEACLGQGVEELTQGEEGALVVLLELEASLIQHLEEVEEEYSFHQEEGVEVEVASSYLVVEVEEPLRPEL
jgi:hypothetical protein